MTINNYKPEAHAMNKSITQDNQEVCIWALLLVKYAVICKGHCISVYENAAD